MAPASAYDFVVIGAGSSGCAVAAGLIRAGSVLVLEAGPTHRTPFVSMPFGLVWLMGSRRRDWRYLSAPQAALGGRRVAMPRGRMLGGSGSINSMVWFRGRRADFDGWKVPGWTWADVAPAFEAIEAVMRPEAFATPHPLVRRLGGMFGGNDNAPADSERQSAGVFRHNMARGRRVSPADGFLASAVAAGVEVRTGQTVQRIELEDDAARVVKLAGGGSVRARRGVVLAAGAIGSPDILLRSGIGPAADLRDAGIDCILDAPGIGANLHDHPSVGLFHSGVGYGLTVGQAASWAAAPFLWAFAGRGRLASPTVEGGLFFGPDAAGAPVYQSHVIPFRLDPSGRRFLPGAGFFADVTLCRPASRGRLQITRDGLRIDPALLSDPADLDRMIEGIALLRGHLAEAGLTGAGSRELFPGPDVQSPEALERHLRAHCATAYHPVGTLAMGAGAAAPVTPRLALRGVRNLWVADASVMPVLTSANSNAPAMMIGHRAAGMIAEDAA